MDFSKEDKIRKELYATEKKCQDKWEEKWGFYQNFRKLCEEEALRLGYPLKIFGWNKQEKSSPRLEAIENNFPKFTVRKLPPLSSGMIGWVSAIDENNLDKLIGPMYVSRKRTMKNPSSTEPDLNHQRCIILG